MNAAAGTVNASESKPRKLNPPRLSEAWRRRLPLLPALIIMIILTQVPFVMSIYYSFTDWHVVPPGPRQWVGLDNYNTMLHDHFFGDAVVVSIKLTVIPVIGSLLLGGASAWGTFRQLTVSHLRPYMELGILLGTIYLIQVYDLVAVMTGGGPGSTNVPYFVFQKSIGGGWEFGLASAYSIVVVIVSIVIATISLRVLSRLLRGEETV